MAGVPNSCQFGALLDDFRCRGLQSQARHELVSQEETFALRIVVSAVNRTYGRKVRLLD